MKFSKITAVFCIFSAVSSVVLADTTNTIKQQGTKNSINNQIIGSGELGGMFTSGKVSVGGTATQNSILINDTKRNSTNTIDLKGGENTINGQGMQNSISVGKQQ